MTSNKHVAVALSFDYDAISLWIGTFGAKTSLTSRGEFGLIAVRRILSTLAHSKIPGTFFVPGHTAYAFPKSVQDIAAAGHEISGQRSVQTAMQTTGTQLGQRLSSSFLPAFF